MADKRDQDLELWNSPTWRGRRSEAAKYRDWYLGTPLKETINKRDRESGSLIRKYPLAFNLPSLACEVHRDICRGIPMQNDTLAVHASIKSEVPRDLAVLWEEIINNKIWRASHGGMLQQEMLLAMEIYGATVAKLSYEPWVWDLPYRLGVRSIKNPSYVLPAWKRQDPFRLTEAWIGYEITPEEAFREYGVTVKDTSTNRRVLYLEYWSPTEWWVRVDGQVPVMEWSDKEWPLKGENQYGFVPVYWIPHERTVDLFGDSQIPGQEEVTKEINARIAGLSDMMQAAYPGLLTGADLGNRSLNVRKIQVDGDVVARVVDLGDTRAGQRGSNPPKLDAFPTPDVPASLLGHPQFLLDFWMMVERISPVTFGTDDTQSGRITGPAVANRMWTSIAHARTCRTNFSTIKSIMDVDALRILDIKREDLSKKPFNVAIPTWDSSLVDGLHVGQTWWPSIPLDRMEQHDQLIERLKASGISLESYLEAQGVTDVESEVSRIRSEEVVRPTVEPEVEETEE